eukprot:scpid44699/ scgid24793/ 
MTTGSTCMGHARLPCTQYCTVAMVDGWTRHGSDHMIPYSLLTWTATITASCTLHRAHHMPPSGYLQPMPLHRAHITCHRVAACSHRPPAICMPSIKTDPLTAICGNPVDRAHASVPAISKPHHHPALHTACC